MKRYDIMMAFLLLLAASPIAAAAGDGKISLYNYHTGESLDVTYRHGKKYDKAQLQKIDHLFRCRADEKEISVDIKLVELLDDIEDHFKAGVIELISGYRSPDLNRKLKKNGDNVAEESQHLLGRAADIHLDEVTEEAVREYALSLKAGGVGFYPASDFVHVDVGDTRSWRLPDKPGRLMMAFTKGVAWQVMTDRDVYLPDEKIDFKVMNITRFGSANVQGISLEKYDRGKWVAVRTIDTCDKKELSSGKECSAVLDEDGFGKFRLVIDGPKGFKHLSALSNEFYRKRL